jgi:leucyl/phenylalanyl-tRNA--protein transferase
MDGLSLPQEPAPSRWLLPDPALAGEEDCIAIGGDLEPGTILQAYRRGLFPMHLPDGGPLGWWSPYRRGIIEIGGLRVTRSLRRSSRRYRTSIDRAFGEVIDGCADPIRSHGWITDDIRDAYVKLHEMGWAHSFESWDGDRLVGGLYGIAIGGAFFGESMFHRTIDASKVALLRLVATVEASGGSFVDVQWATEHLVSLGAVQISRLDYLHRLADAVNRPLLSLWTDEDRLRPLEAPR